LTKAIHQSNNLGKANKTDYKTMKSTQHYNSANSLALLLVLLLTAVGCSSTKVKKDKPVPWNVSLAKANPSSSIPLVDMVGVTPLAKSYWQNLNVADYCTPGSPEREGAWKVTGTFKGNPTWTLKQDDPIWKTWLSRGVTELMVIADLPHKHPPGASDHACRVFLRLDKNAFISDTHTIEVEIQDSHVQVLTPEKP
jgi:hypothetical protein